MRFPKNKQENPSLSAQQFKKKPTAYETVGFA